MSFANHFSTIAHFYADYRPHYPEAMFAWLAQQTSGHALVWDCACGNGQASLGLANHFDRVIATDASEQQIAAAKMHPTIDYRVAMAESSGLPDHSADLVTVGQAMHWFDVDKFQAEVKRVGKPGSVFAAWCYDYARADNAAIEAIIRTYRKETLHSYWPDNVKFVQEKYMTLPFPFEEITAPAFSLYVSWTLDDLLGHFHSWSATARYIKTHNADPVMLVKHELEQVWGTPQTRYRIWWPLYMRVGRI